MLIYSISASPALIDELRDALQGKPSAWLAAAYAVATTRARRDHLEAVSRNAARHLDALEAPFDRSDWDAVARHHRARYGRLSKDLLVELALDFLQSTGLTDLRGTYYLDAAGEYRFTLPED